MYATLGDSDKKRRFWVGKKKKVRDTELRYGCYHTRLLLLLEEEMEPLQEHRLIDSSTENSNSSPPPPPPPPNIRRESEY